MDPIEINRAAYDQIAGRFAERNAEMLPYIVDSAERWLEAIHQAGSSALPVLDLGCGTGRDTAWLEAHGAYMLGADLSRGMLVEAQKRVRGPLFQLDMRFLPFRGEALAGIWCQAALLHLPKALAPAALREAWRALKPGGLLHVSVQRGDSEGIETRPYEATERYYAHYQPDEFNRLVRAAGFVIVYQGQEESRRTWLLITGQKPTGA
jgi:SAM-dependent methyltransferase